jgi:hypothetical protein
MVSAEFSGTFPRSGMMRNGTVYQLPNLARTITEIGSGLLPTPAWVRGREDGGHANWEAEPDVGRVADGIPDRAHRIKGLGNAVVPQIPELIGRAILEVENEK